MDMFLMKGGMGMDGQSSSRHKLKAGQAQSQDEPLLAMNGHNGEPTVSVHVQGGSSVNQQPTNPRNEDTRFGIAPEMFAAVKWAIIIAIMLMFMQQFSGINAVFFYSSTILKKAGLTSDLALWLGSSGISLANFFAVFIAVATIDHAGRKLLLIISCVIMMA